MTDETDDREHPGDEALSAALDGEDTAAAAHAAGCAVCGPRLDALRAVSAAVAAPVEPVAADTRDRAIAAALDRAAESTVADMRPRRDWAREAWPVLAAVAAVVLLAIPLVALLRGGGGDDESASGGDDSTAATAESDSSLEAPAEGVIDGGDLGEVDPADLRAAVEPLLAGSTAFATGEEAEGAADAAETTSTAPAPVGGSAGSGASGEDDEGDSDGAGPAPQAAAPPSAAREACEAAIRADDPAVGTLRYTATATVDGEAVLVLAFDVPGGESQQHRLYVVAQDGCRIVNVQSF